jgi:hypothetical protein
MHVGDTIARVLLGISHPDDHGKSTGVLPTRVPPTCIVLFLGARNVPEACSFRIHTVIAKQQRQQCE